MNDLDGPGLPTGQAVRTKAFTIDGQPVYVAVAPTEVEADSLQRFSAENRAPQDVSEAMDRALPAAELLMKKLSSLDLAPREIEVTFGLTLSGEVGAFIAKTSVEGNFEVKLKWTKS